MQSQRGTSDKLVLAAAPAATKAGEVFAAGDTLGIAADTVAAGEAVVLYARGEFGTTRVIAKEAWQPGQRTYWHETAQVFTARQTHWPVGRAGDAKAVDAAFGAVQLDAPHRVPDEVTAPFAYEQTPELGARGVYVLREFGAPVMLLGVEVVSSGLSPGTARFMLGDGTGNSDQIVSSKPVSELTGFDDAAALGADLSPLVERLALRITTADLAGGFLCVRASYARVG